MSTYWELYVSVQSAPQRMFVCCWMELCLNCYKLKFQCNGCWMYEKCSMKTVVSFTTFHSCITIFRLDNVEQYSKQWSLRSANQNGHKEQTKRTITIDSFLICAFSPSCNIYSIPPKMHHNPFCFQILQVLGVHEFVAFLFRATLFIFLFNVILNANLQHLS